MSSTSTITTFGCARPTIDSAGQSGSESKKVRPIEPAKSTYAKDSFSLAVFRFKIFNTLQLRVTYAASLTHR